MQLVTNIVIVINILTILMFLFAELFIYKKSQKPKIKAAFGACLTAILFLYLLSLLIISLYGVFKQEYRYLIFMLWIVFPFIIGNFTEYKTLKKAAYLQICLFCMSLFLLFCI